MEKMEMKEKMPKEAMHGKKLDSTTVRRASNGFVVSCSYRSEKKEKGFDYPSMMPSEDHVFENAASMMEFLAKEWGE